MGGKKGGLGATKVQTNFEDLEREAQMADTLRSQKAVEPKAEDVEAQTNSLRLAYQDLSLESKKQSERLQKVDPSKAQQLERLGMGIMAANSGPRLVFFKNAVFFFCQFYEFAPYFFMTTRVYDVYKNPRHFWVIGNIFISGTLAIQQ